MRGIFLATPLLSCMSGFGGPYARSCGMSRREEAIQRAGLPVIMQS